MFRGGLTWLPRASAPTRWRTNPMSAMPEQKSVNTQGGVVVADVVSRAVREAYGDTEMAAALVSRLTRMIEANDWCDRGREYAVMWACWIRFPGGDTAASVARRVEKQLGVSCPIRVER